MPTCSWSGSTVPGAMRVSDVTSPLARSNSSVLISMPGKRVLRQGRLSTSTRREASGASAAWAWMSGVTAVVMGLLRCGLSRPVPRCSGALHYRGRLWPLVGEADRPMSSLSLVFGACAFASGFALRIVDPLILPVAGHFAVTPATAALLTSAYALPYALAQPLLGPLGDRFGKER